MNASIETIERIGQKLQGLLKQQEQLQRDQEKLLSELSKRENEVKTLHQKIGLLEDQVAILKTATVQMDDPAKRMFEKRINGFIKDIDKVIAHLQSES